MKISEHGRVVDSVIQMWTGGRRWLEGGCMLRKGSCTRTNLADAELWPDFGKVMIAGRPERI